MAFLLLEQDLETAQRLEVAEVSRFFDAFSVPEDVRLMAAAWMSHRLCTQALKLVG